MPGSRRRLGFGAAHLSSLCACACTCACPHVLLALGVFTAHSKHCVPGAWGGRSDWGVQWAGQGAPRGAGTCCGWSLRTPRHAAPNSLHAEADAHPTLCSVNPSPPVKKALVLHELRWRDPAGAASRSLPHASMVIVLECRPGLTVARSPCHARLFPVLHPHVQNPSESCVCLSLCHPLFLISAPHRCPLVHSPPFSTPPLLFSLEN